MTVAASLLYLSLLLPVAELSNTSSTASTDLKSPEEPLRCYVCDSRENLECGSEDSEVLSHFEMACKDTSHTNCHISKETFNNGTMTTKRFCNLDRHTPCNENKEISSVCYCACDENLCNVNDPANGKNSCVFGGGAPIRPWLPLSILLPLLIIQITTTGFLAGQQGHYHHHHLRSIQ